MIVTIKEFNEGLRYRLLFCAGLSAKTKKPNSVFIMHNGLYKIANQIVGLDGYVKGYNIPSKSYYSCNAAMKDYITEINVKNNGIYREDGKLQLIDMDTLQYKLKERLITEC